MPTAAQLAAQGVNPAPDQSDHYAAFRRLPANAFQWQEAKDAWQDDNAGDAPRYYGPTPAQWALGQGTPAFEGTPFHSKYGGRVSDLGNGRVGLTMQQPGAHKYDTMQAVFAPDPVTGEWVLQDDPMNSKTREVSYGEEFRDNVELAGKAVLAAGALYLGGVGLTGGAGALGTSMGAGAAGSTSAAVAGGATIGGVTAGTAAGLQGDRQWHQAALKGAAMGGASAYAGAQFGGGAGTNIDPATTAGDYMNQMDLASNAADAARLNFDIPYTSGPVDANFPTEGPISGTKQIPAGNSGGWMEAAANGVKGMNAGNWIQLAGLGIGAIGADRARDKATDAANRATDAANKSAADTAALGREQLDFTKTQYYDGKAQRDAVVATALEVSKAQLASQQQQDALAKEYADYNRTTFRPLEQGIVKSAQEYDTPEKRQAAADSALADVDMGAAAVQQARARQLAASGVNPGSAKSMAIMSSAGLDQARSGAGAAYQARKGVETTGFARQMDAASLGRNLPSAQATSAGLALNAGNSAVNNAVNGVNVNNAGVAGMQAGYGQAANATSAAGNLYSSAAAQAQRSAEASAQLWSNLGTAAGTAASRWSDKTLKKDIQPVSDEQALEQVQATPVATWKYDAAKMAERGIPMNAEDYGEQTGPMAQDVNATMGEQAAPKGKKVNLVTLNGRTMAATRAVNNKVDRLAEVVTSLASMIRDGKLQGVAA